MVVNRKPLPGTLNKDLLELKNKLKDFNVEQISRCVGEALSQEKVVPGQSKKPKAVVTKPKGKCHRCSVMLKVLWISLIVFLGLGFMAVGFKPVAFLVHKSVHDRLYYILRPVRLAMISIIPALDKFGMDFLNTDCMLENPSLSHPDGCPCFRIKYPKEVTLNDSSLPMYMTEGDVLDVYVVRNMTKFDPDLTISSFVDFPSAYFGRFPMVCNEIIGPNSELFRYDDFFVEASLKKVLSQDKPWSFSWVECPDAENPLSLHSLIPPPPQVPADTRSVFTISNKWATFPYLSDIFPSGSVVLVRVVLGEVRFMMEPKTDECFNTCSNFRENPVLRQGDALLFDQRAWSYNGVSWTSITFITIQLVSDTDSFELPDLLNHDAL